MSKSNINSDILSDALDNYFHKNSNTRSIFLADYKLLINFRNYYDKFYNKNPTNIHNQLVIIFNLFERSFVLNFLYTQFPEDYDKLANFLE